MINKKQIVSDLDRLLNKSIDLSLFPYAKGNSIRIGKYIVREGKNGYYKVFSCETNSLITETFSKRAALAIAKLLSKGNTIDVNDVKHLDKSAQKWYNDCVFYKYTINKTKDEVKKEITQTRYDIAKYKTKSVKDQLDKYIYS